MPHPSGDHSAFVVWELTGSLVLFFAIVVGCAIAMLLAAIATAPAIIVVAWLRSAGTPNNSTQAPLRGEPKSNQKA
jgi:hypothetical protein